MWEGAGGAQPLPTFLDTLAAVPAPGCASSQPRSGTLPLCRAVMRFLLGCLDRKSETGDAESLRQPWQPPAPAHRARRCPQPHTWDPQPCRGHRHPLQLGHPLWWLSRGAHGVPRAVALLPSPPCSPHLCHSHPSPTAVSPSAGQGGPSAMAPRPRDPLGPGRAQGAAAGPCPRLVSEPAALQHNKSASLKAPSAAAGAGGCAGRAGPGFAVS